MFATLTLLPGGQFWTRPHLVDSTDEEIDAIMRGLIAPERIEQVAAATKMACTSLMSREVAGRC